MLEKHQRDVAMSNVRTIRTVLITGASGNLGTKLRHHVQGRYELRLLDRDPRGDAAILRTDLSVWDSQWVEQFRGVDVVVHLAADPTAQQTWPNLLAPNVDAVVYAFLAAVKGGVPRFVYASSNHVLGGYSDDTEPAQLTAQTPPRPGARYVVHGEQRDSTPYGSAKLFGERLGKCFAESDGLEVIAVRIGWVKPGENRPEDIPPERGPWFRLMWLSNRDFCQLMECCLVACLPEKFLIVNGMSANTGMRWDIEPACRLLGYRPLDDVMRSGFPSPA
jgi:NAD+ dependent glucose-6-phosphate dehydrogenase